VPVCAKWCPCCSSEFVSSAGSDEPVEAIEKMFPKMEQPLDPDSLRTGDIFLCHLVHKFGVAIQALDSTPWDHIAVVVRQRGERPSDLKPRPTQDVNPDFYNSVVWEPMRDGQLQLFETNGTGTWTYPLEQFVRVNSKKCPYIALRRMRWKDDAFRDAALEKIEEFVREVWGRGYETNYLDLESAILGRKPDPHTLVDKSHEHLSSIFCSELIAEAYQRAGLLPEDTLNSDQCMPSSFSTRRGVIDRFLADASIGGGVMASLEDEVLIKWPGQSLDDIFRHGPEQQS